MTVIVNWQNCTRTPGERVLVELGYRNRLLELCDGEAAAKRYHDEHAWAKSPCTAWARLNAVACIEATAALLPSERRDARFTVRFE